MSNTTRGPPVNFVFRAYIIRRLLSTAWTSHFHVLRDETGLHLLGVLNILELLTVFEWCGGISRGLDLFVLIQAERFFLLCYNFLGVDGNTPLTHAA